MWHSGRKSQRRQSAILPASILSFFFLAKAMARSISGCATSTASAWGSRWSKIQPAKMVASIVRGWGKVTIHASSSRRVEPILPSR
jgi:hypothetical protein